MNLITTPRTTNNDLHTLAESTVEICRPFSDDLGEDLPIAENKLADFEQGLQKDKQLDADKKVADKIRDRPIVGMKYHIKAEEYFPNHSEDVTNCIALLNDTLNKYDRNMNTLSYDKQTAAEKMFLAEVKALDLNPLQNTGLLRWIPIIEQTNNDFEAIAGSARTEKAESIGQLSATLLAPALEDALDSLYRKMFAHAVLGQNKNIVSAYEELEILVNSKK